jgi:hypothetical protein
MCFRRYPLQQFPNLVRGGIEGGKTLTAHDPQAFSDGSPGADALSSFSIDVFGRFVALGQVAEDLTMRGFTLFEKGGLRMGQFVSP